MSRPTPLARESGDRSEAARQESFSRLAPGCHSRGSQPRTSRSGTSFPAAGLLPVRGWTRNLKSRRLARTSLAAYLADRQQFRVHPLAEVSRLGCSIQPDDRRAGRRKGKEGWPSVVESASGLVVQSSSRPVVQLSSCPVVQCAGVAQTSSRPVVRPVVQWSGSPSCPVVPGSHQGVESAWLALAQVISVIAGTAPPSATQSVDRAFPLCSH